LGSTWSSTKAMNEVFVRMKQNMTPELRDRIAKLEAAGLFGHGKDYEKNRYTAEYMIAAWGEGYFPIKARLSHNGQLCRHRTNSTKANDTSTNPAAVAAGCKLVGGVPILLRRSSSILS